MDEKFLRQSQNPCIMSSIDPYITAIDNMQNGNVLTSDLLSAQEDLLDLDSLDIYSPDENYDSFILLDENEKLRVPNPETFLKCLRVPAKVKKVKVVSIFGNTGEGKSHTLNHVFFSGKEVFPTSAKQTSCTLGVWAAFDPKLNAICLDTEGLLGLSTKEDQRMRMLLKVLAVSDIVIYRTKSERLQRDMYTFLSGASKSYKDHFQTAIQEVCKKADFEGFSTTPGPSVIIFHETSHTNTLDVCANVSESPEDILRTGFSELNLPIDAFSSLKYIGVQSRDNKEPPFKQLRNVIQIDLENTTVRSPRHPKVVYQTLEGLNVKFGSKLKNAIPELHLEQYFSCQEKCQTCGSRCSLSMGHKEEQKSHSTVDQCRYQHQYQNCVYLCKKCYRKGERVIVKPSFQSIADNSWTSFLNYVWSGYVIECKNCGEIYRSRQHWYGNKDPEDCAVLTEIVHIWPGSEYYFQEKNFFGGQNSAQRVLDGVSSISDTLLTAQTTKAATAWVTDKLAPNYWKPNNEITECYKCKAMFAPSAAKHHCRSCGEGFCEQCSSKKQPVPNRGWYTDVRVCDNCYQEQPPSLSQSRDDKEIQLRKFSEAVVHLIAPLASVVEIPKGIIKDTARPSYWTPDHLCQNCTCCDAQFTPLNLLHHCRDCGRGVCDDCSKTRKLVPFRGWDSPVRVCNNCVNGTNNY